MKLVLIVFLFCNSAIGQFTQVWTIPSDYFSFDVRSFEMSDNGEGLIGARPYNGGPNSNLMFYSTLNFGNTWDSTYFVDKAMTRCNGGVTDGGNMYFISLESYFPVGMPGIQIKVFNGSEDGGANWFSQIIDTIVGANFENSLEFMNDTIGTYFYQNGIYITTDFGHTWEKKAPDYPTNALAVDTNFMYFGYNLGITLDPITAIRDSFEYKSHAVGQVYFSDFNDNTIYRCTDAQDGANQGSQYNGNYSSINIDQLPLGNQKVVHFPTRFLTFGIEVTETCIHMILGGRYVRSCDGGDTFYNVDAFNGNNDEAVYFMDFINDTLGFLITKNVTSNTWHLWKTENGGGQNGAQIFTNIIYPSANLNELKKDVSFEIYPNPANNVLNIESKYLISKIIIYSIDGKLVLSESFQTKNPKIDIFTLINGNYIVKVFSENSIGVSKLTIE